MIPHISRNTTQDRWLAEATEQVHAEVRCVPGSLYRFSGMRGPNRADGSLTWVFEPGDYRFIGVATDVRTWQELCVYQGVGGRDDGKIYCCTLSDWAENFTLLRPELQVGKVIDLAKEGNEGRGEG